MKKPSNKTATRGAVGPSVLSDNDIRKSILTNLSLGRGFSDQEREAVEKSSTTKLRAILPTLLGHKRKQAPILALLGSTRPFECAKCGNKLPLSKACKSAYSFEIVCPKCHAGNGKHSMIIIDEVAPMLPNDQGEERDVNASNPSRHKQGEAIIIGLSLLAGWLLILLMIFGIGHPETAEQAIPLIALSLGIGPTVGFALYMIGGVAVGTVMCWFRDRRSRRVWANVKGEAPISDPPQPRKEL